MIKYFLAIWFLLVAGGLVAGETNRVVQMLVRYDPFQPKDTPVDVYFGADTNAIRTLDDLKARIKDLPRETTLYWHSGCSFYSFVPVGTNRIEMKKFVKMCEEAGMKFDYSCGF